MFNIIIPVILAGASVAVALLFINPTYSEIATLKEQKVSYNEALDNSKALEEVRDSLIQQYNGISVENLDKLRKFLPENVDNIRLILEIEKIALPYGMILKDVQYSTLDTTATPVPGVIQGGYIESTPKDYGVWDLEFSTAGTYLNLINFIKDLERNLRIVDVSAIEFSSETGGGLETDPTLEVAYQYKFKIKTYWLKN